MKIKVRLMKDRRTLLENDYEVGDADSFGRACADAFAQLRSRELDSATSVGAMMDMLNRSVLDVLDGATITIDKA